MSADNMNLDVSDKPSKGGGNLFFAIIKLFIFFVLLCFVVEITRKFLIEARVANGFTLTTLLYAITSCFLFSAFIADLTGLYKTIQMFFFRSAFASYIVPFLMILTGLACFVIPKIFKMPFSPDAFVFAGGFIFICHLMYVAQETRGGNFSEFAHYLFIFSIIYTINLLLLGAYFNAAFKFNIARVAVDGVTDGAMLLRNIFSQLFGR